MDKFIVFVKKYRKKIIVCAILLIILAIFLFSAYRLYKFLTPDTRNSVYGDRCELTDDIDITKEREEMVKDVINENEGMTLSKINVKCNLIDITVKVEDDVKVDDVKKMADKILTVFTEEELKYYDIELMVDSTAEESEVYPIIGTRHKTNIDGNAEAKFVW